MTRTRIVAALLCTLVGGGCGHGPSPEGLFLLQQHIQSIQPAPVMRCTTLAGSPYAGAPYTTECRQERGW